MLKAQKEDMVFIALSGHGAQDGKNVYFCPPDVEIEDLKGTCVSINNVMDILANTCKAKFKWMVIDACRNDPTRGAKGIGGKGLQVIPTPPAGIALFQSCAEGEESWEDYDSGKGFFTKNLVAALSGDADSNNDGNLTLMEVCKWTTAKTKEQVMNNKNKSQRPYVSGSFSDFILAEDIIFLKAQELVKEARKAVTAKNYELAIEKYEEAIALCPRVEDWKRELKLVQKLVNAGSASDTLDSPGKSAGERRIVTVKGVEFAFRWCPPGTFMMGAPREEEDAYMPYYYNEKPHEVTLTNGFWMQETELTQKQWEAVMETNPSGFKGDDLPVERVTWNDCQDFCKRCKQLGFPFQLPTEAQWEYACRAGTTGPYAGNITEMAWYMGNSGPETHPVGKLKPNTWGLYDMHGNVWEFCADEKPSGTPKEQNTYRAKRGGCVGNRPPEGLRSASRFIFDLEDKWFNRSYNTGFRCVRTITNQDN
ncbi:MAG: SUMF1/EgtB/PvdO family nonheme iron enzyme [Thermoguttaceae bacterium]|nr:SUMF1/EgtB/PvdO family nonheme iron enzyme [Thermoguttaceae bacterium]